MAQTYLLTWNPRITDWHDLEVEAQQTANGISVDGAWSCGRTKRIEVGDRIFLLRQGLEPRGIVASGIAISAPYEERHWDEDRGEQGDTALYVEIKFDKILHVEMGDEPLLLSKLQRGELSKVNWKPQASGMQIKYGVDELEVLWREHLGLFEDSEDRDADQMGLEGAVKMSLRRHRARERWLRDAKLEAIKNANDGRVRCEVPGCGFDFFEVYGEIGRDFAHVHHLRPLGTLSRPSMTRLEDLAVVCANCHAMIHRGGRNNSLAALIRAGRNDQQDIEA